MLAFSWFIVGAILGSFGLLVMERTPKLGFPQSIYGRSKCLTCQKTLRPLDLIPIVSYIFILGKCRYCQKPIGIKYLIAEIIFGFVGLTLAIVFSNPVVILVNLLIITLLLIVAGIDFQTQEIIEIMIVIAAILALALNIYLKTPLGVQLYGIIAGAGLFVLLVLVSRGKWMGVGDIEIGALLGLWLGYPSILVALFLAFMTGSIYGVYLIQTQKAKMKTAVAFAPFLVIGGIVTLYFGKIVLKWYLG